ncbi:hypothetical protein F5Y10DRAFT_286020 [Nemania abortiva]|nr:hypothetical protein F5Y10DRAFT_286020 [Nemania abortiva]
MANVIGLVAGILCIVQFGFDNLSPPKPEGSTVRITVGLDVNGGLSNSGGDLPDIRLFNEAGGFLGISADPGKVESGKFSDITVRHKGDAGDQATYTLFSANNDAICVAAASITWPNGDSYGWVGDWGRRCGGTWYYSNVYIGSTQYTPDCLWIDANNDQPQTGFQVHWPEFANKNSSKIPDTPEDQAAKIDSLCSAGPPFKMYVQPDTDPNGITYWVPRTRRSSGLDQRGVATTSYGLPKHSIHSKYRRNIRTNGTTVPNVIGTSLVISDSDTHSATDLCESETSYGPDFFNVKTGMFCRMSDKTLWPMCNSTSVAGNCFNVDSQELVINGLAARGEPYKKIIDWTSSQ